MYRSTVPATPNPIERLPSRQRSTATRHVNLRVIGNHGYYPSSRALKLEWDRIGDNKLTRRETQIYRRSAASWVIGSVHRPGPNITITRLVNVNAQYEPPSWVKAARRMPTKNAIIDARKMRSPRYRVIRIGTRSAAITPIAVSVRLSDR
jgi:hypothetical protein